MINAGISKKYVRELHIFVHVVLEMAFKEGIIPRNYADAATLPKKIRPDVDALSWEDIDFEKNRIHICKHFVLDKTGRHVEDGCKTTAGERWLYMDKGIMKMLADYHRFWINRAMEQGSKCSVFTRAVFVSTHDPDEHLSPNTVREWLRRFLDKNNMPRIHPHQFRHTAISLQLQSGISVPDVAKRAGHTRPDVTMSIYAHTLKNNDVHCCEAVTKAIPKMPKRKTG